ncbi:MAG: 2'-5' RNA ligase family protein [Gemmatimonadaceae bacterium]
MKPGTVVMFELAGPLAARVRELHAAFDPRMAAELPPHITITGSSGMGPIAPEVTDEELRRALEPVALEIAPFSVRLEAPMQFMQSTVVVMPINPNGPIRSLHEQIKMAGLPYEPPRFTFTPHLTLSFYPELTRERLRELLRFRVSEPVLIDAIQAYRAADLSQTTRVLDLPLGGAPRP